MGKMHRQITVEANELVILVKRQNWLSDVHLKYYRNSNITFWEQHMVLHRGFKKYTLFI